MKTYKLYRENNKLFAFEIENIYIRPKKIAKLLGTVTDVSNVKVRKLFSTSDDIHVRFKYQCKDFMVWEPYGDNSRYWIGAEHEEDEVDIKALSNVFDNYQPPIFIKILGDIISLNFKFLFKKK